MTINKLFLILLICSFFGIRAQAQIKIGDNPITLNSDAVLEIESTDKGVLLPRLALTSTTSTTPLSVHTAGMIVYNTATAGDVTPGFYYNNGSNWILIGAKMEDEFIPNPYGAGVMLASQAALGDTLIIENGVIKTKGSIGISRYGSGNRNSYIDLFSDDDNLNRNARIIRGPGENGNFRVENSTGNGVFTISNNKGGEIRLQTTTATSDLVVDNAGNVGIGTTSPTTKLQVEGNARVQDTLFISGDAAKKFLTTTEVNSLLLSTQQNIVLHASSNGGATTEGVYMKAGVDKEDFFSVRNDGTAVFEKVGASKADKAGIYVNNDGELIAFDTMSNQVVLTDLKSGEWSPGTDLSPSENGVVFSQSVEAGGSGNRIRIYDQGMLTINNTGRNSMIAVDAPAVSPALSTTMNAAKLTNANYDGSGNLVNLRGIEILAADAASNAQDLNEIKASQQSALKKGTGNLFNLFGTATTAKIESTSTGTVNNMVTLESRLEHTDNATNIGTASIFHGNYVANNTYTGTVTNMHGLKIEGSGFSNTSYNAVNKYGVFITNVAPSTTAPGATAHAIYTNNGKVSLGDDVEMRSSGYLKLPSGGTAARPVAPEAGMIRFNTNSGVFEGFDGTNWVNLN